jgi:hypothetical protein
MIIMQAERMTLANEVLSHGNVVIVIGNSKILVARRPGLNVSAGRLLGSWSD